MPWNVPWFCNSSLSYLFLQQSKQIKHKSLSKVDAESDFTFHCIWRLTLVFSYYQLLIIQYLHQIPSICISYNVKTTSLIFCRTPLWHQNSFDPLRYGLHKSSEFGTNILLVLLWGEAWFVHHMLHWFEIWGIWSPSQHFKLMFFIPSLNSFCSVAGHNILLKDATAIRE